MFFLPYLIWITLMIMFNFSTEKINEIKLLKIEIFEWKSLLNQFKLEREEGSGFTRLLISQRLLKLQSSMTAKNLYQNSWNVDDYFNPKITKESFIFALKIDNQRSVEIQYRMIDWNCYDKALEWVDTFFQCKILTTVLAHTKLMHLAF